MRNSPINIADKILPRKKILIETINDDINFNNNLMGTLGCINDMLQRDKENRELRKLNRDRIREHHKYLVEKGTDADLSHISIEQLEEIRKKNLEKEKSDNASIFKTNSIRNKQ